MRIALLGVGYFPHKTAGEKNFYLALNPLFKKSFKEVIVISVNDQTPHYFIQETDHGSIKIYNLKRPLHFGNTDRFFGEMNGVFHYHHRHYPIQELSEKFLTILLNTKKIKKIISKHKINLIYFLDNFGFGMKYLKTITGKKVAFAAANYEPRSICYNKIQSFFLKGLDVIITYSNAYKNILVNLNIKKEKIYTIHWGVDTSRYKPLDISEKNTIKDSLGINKDKFVILWTGYIQQIQECDFYKTVNIAKKFLAISSKVEFIFCFKPESFKTKYLDEGEKALKILNGIRDFGSLLSAVDLLISPIHKLESSVSPPLTWVEAMARGIPVITTSALGTDEIINHGVDGFITHNYTTLLDDLVNIQKSGVSSEISTKAREKICTEYDLQTIANRYFEIFSKAKS